MDKASKAIRKKKIFIHQKKLFRSFLEKSQFRSAVFQKINTQFVNWEILFHNLHRDVFTDNNP